MTDLGDHADHVIRAFYQTFARSVGGHIVERNGVVACLGVDPSPIVTNTAWRSDPSTAPSTVLRVIDEIYGDAGFVGTLLTSARSDADLVTAAQAGRRRLAAELPVMVLKRPAARSAIMPTPPGAEVRPVDPVADLAAFRTVLVDGFFEGDEGGRSLIEATFADPGTLAPPGIGAFLAELDGRPVAVAGAWSVGRDAGIGWVATIPSARRRGFGALVTSRSVEYAFDHGAEVAVLQASPSGRPVYERLGFTAVGLDRLWEPPID